MRLTSFPPVVSRETRVLILGSMPGTRSLAEHQYYAHPRNLFWPFMEELFGIGRDRPYEQRLQELLARGIGLWDVLQHCEREGSLDSRIVPATEVPNDFRELLGACPELRAICFNGQKAAQAFRRHVIPVLNPAALARIELVPLPSTSPANAGQSQANKLGIWRQLWRQLAT